VSHIWCACARGLVKLCMHVREGDIGICVWFGAPIMHRMSSLNLA